MPEHIDALSAENISTLDRLVLAVNLAEEFVLFFARCNVPALRDDLMAIIRERLAALDIATVEIAFEDEPANVRERVRSALLAATNAAEMPIPVELSPSPQPLAVAEPAARYRTAKHVVFISGLELGIPYDQPNGRVLAELNLGRDLLPRDVPHPLVIWLPDYALTAVARFAPDFWAWRSGVFEFETSDSERSVAFEQSTWRDQPWHTLTNLTPKARLLRRRQLESLLDDYRELPDDTQIARERMAILSDLGHLGAAAQDFSNTLAYFEQALEIARKVNDKTKEAETLDDIGYVYDALGDKRQALDFYEQALPLQRQVGDRGGEATTLNNIGGVYAALGDKRQALDFYEQALPLRRQVGDRGGEATTLNNIGGVYADLGDKRQALDFYEQALPIYRQVGDRGGEATTLNNIGGVYAALGDKRKALDFYEQALPICRQVGDRWGESITRYNIGMVHEASGDIEKAEEQLAMVVALDEAIEHPDLASDRAALERVQAKRKAGANKR